VYVTDWQDAREVQCFGVAQGATGRGGAGMAAPRNPSCWAHCGERPVTASSALRMRLAWPPFPGRSPDRPAVASAGRADRAPYRCW
jgi:hypothetical protein